MKRLIPIMLILIVNSLTGQNIWEPVNFPDTLNAQTINAENEDFIFVTAKGPLWVKYLLRSNNDGLTWETLNLTTPHYYNFYTINYNSDGVLFVGDNHNIFRSFNNGNSFDTVYTNSDIQDIVLKIRSFDNNEVYALGRAIILRSIDNGNSWDTIYNSNNFWQYFEDIDIDVNGNIFAVGGTYDSVGNGFYRSLDHGETWENIGITDKYLQTIKVNSNGILIVSGIGLDGIYSSLDLGETWISRSDLQINVMESFLNNKLVAGSNIDNSSGCWLSIDWGNNWLDIIDSVINPRVHQISISPSKHIYIQSDYYAESNQLFKSINPILNINNRPATLNILIYPNPANDRLELKYSSQKKYDQFVIYNLNGQKILNGEVTYNSVDITALKSGLYIITIMTENEIITNKIIKK